MICLRERNLLGTIESFLKEHQVNIHLDSSGKSTVPFYLIEGHTESSPARDFTDTYPEADEFKRKMAAKLLGEQPVDQTYGVLVDTNLRYVFAFNRKFADLNESRNRLNFRNVEDLLLETSDGNDLSQALSGIGIEVIQPNDDDIRVRYSLAEGKGNKKQNSPPKEVNPEKDFGRKSMIDRIRKSFGKPVKLNGEEGKFYMVRTSYQTSKIADFETTYGSEANEFQRKLAKKQFGDKKTNNSYTTLLDSNLTIRFAFNGAFASYDQKKGDVIYTPVEELLLNASGDTDLSKAPTLKPNRPPRHNGGQAVYRYALVGKKD